MTSQPPQELSSLSQTSGLTSTSPPAADTPQHKSSSTPGSPTTSKADEDDTKPRGLNMSSLYPVVPELDIAEMHPGGTTSAPTSPVTFDLDFDLDDLDEEEEEFDSDDDGELADRGLFWRSKRELTPEEEELKRNVRRRVLKSAFATLGTVADLTASLLHEALELGVDFLNLAPVPGLAPAAKIVLNIWDAVENVDMNHLACLRLTERCADLLLSVRMEVRDAGDVVVEELRDPMRRLEESYTQVLTFLHAHNHTPFVKRYLKRDDIQRDIAGLDMALRDALNLFGLSVQIRILKQVQEAERKRQKDTQDILMQLLALHPLPTPPSSSKAEPEESRSVEIPESESDVKKARVQSPEEVQNTLSRIMELQNKEDREKDRLNLKEVSKAFGGARRG